MKTYTPFDNKHNNDVVTKDLIVLKDTVEGWFVEYKRVSIAAEKMAKSISAFANTYGGWLFIGIEEESKDNSVAGSFPGIPTSDVDPVLQRLRKSAADFLNPTPYFETYVFRGPDETIGLAEDHSIIAVWIPQSMTAPHIHKTGQIYRRVSDASEPVVENDRFILDQLWRRSDGLKKFHKDWFEQDPHFSDSEKSTPFVRLMIVADPMLERDVLIKDDIKLIREALGGKSGVVTSIPFDTIYTTSDGYIGRQLTGNDPHNLGLTWHLSNDLISDVIIPLPLYKVDQPDELLSHLKGYDHVAKFIKVISKYKINTLQTIDLTYLFNILIGVVETQERLCKLANWNESYYIKIKLLNAWRTVPFIDVAEIVDYFDEFGLTMCLSSNDFSPKGVDHNSYKEISRFKDEEEFGKIIYQALSIFAPLAYMFGIPPWFEYDENDSKPIYFSSLQAAGNRAMAVQQHRNNRQHK